MGGAGGLESLLDPAKKPSVNATESLLTGLFCALASSSIERNIDEDVWGWWKKTFERSIDPRSKDCSSKVP
jgi:hypothetical protein